MACRPDWGGTFLLLGKLFKNFNSGSCIFENLRRNSTQVTRRLRQFTKFLFCTLCNLTADDTVTLERQALIFGNKFKVLCIHLIDNAMVTDVDTEIMVIAQNRRAHNVVRRRQTL